MKKQFIIIVCMLTLLSCKKSGYGYVDGHVYEAGTELPISGTKLLLVSYHTSEAAIGQTKTDENGYFKIAYTKTIFPGYRYYLSISETQGYYLLNYNKYVTNKKENKEFYLTPIAYAKFHVINNTANDYTVTVTNATFSKLTTLTGSAFENKICPNYLEVSGNATTTIKWEYLNTTHYGNLISTQKHDTVVYSITLN